MLQQAEREYIIYKIDDDNHWNEQELDKYTIDSKRTMKLIQDNIKHKIDLGSVTIENKIKSHQ